jgi:hypothetical protein
MDEDKQPSGFLLYLMNTPAGLARTFQRNAISLLVPRSNSTLLQDLRDAIRSNFRGSGTFLKPSTGDYCYIEVACGPSRQETWWAVKQIVSEVERRHKAGRVVEMMG